MKILSAFVKVFGLTTLLFFSIMPILRGSSYEIFFFYSNTGIWKNAERLLLEENSSDKLQEFPEIISKVTEADYNHLENLLANGKWREADRITWVLMLVNLDRNNDDKLNQDEVDRIKDFSCADLNKINQLWLLHSSGNFGFTLQKNVYLTQGGLLDNWDFDRDIKTIRRLAIQVGWKNGTDANSLGYKYHQELTFNLNAPQGHLPSLGGISSTWSAPYWVSLFSRLQECSFGNIN